MQLYLSQINQYKPFFSILKHTFARVLFQAGVADPESFYEAEDVEVRPTSVVFVCSRNKR